ncbi:GATA transcription factor 26 [Glycine max]|uniref:GATA transcription factor 26 n=1 Tax=Glycine soja TaxID=3848 RepID=A0A445IYC3_GLYSO|nr:GATA transcription factor 26 [Glycine max]RZB91106.1 GATA transcription factor 26 [Glycine soja]
MVKQGPCSHCKINFTPLWRNGPVDKPVLCNACGTRYKKGDLDNYLPKNVHPQLHHNNFKNVNGESHFNAEESLSNHIPPITTSNGDNYKSSSDVHHISAQGGINSDFEKKIPSRKRSSVVYKPMTPMEKFQKQLLSLYRSERQPEESLLVDNVNNFIPENEIGLGAILLKTDDAASTDPGSANR